MSKSRRPLLFSQGSDNVPDFSRTAYGFLENNRPDPDHGNLRDSAATNIIFFSRSSKLLCVRHDKTLTHS